MVGLGWTEEAACQYEPELPWIGPKRGQILQRAELDRMAEICRACPVQAACHSYVRDADVSAGFWAGAWQHLDTEDHAGGRVA